MATTIKLKNSTVASQVPVVGDLILGELAVNSYDGKIFLKKNNGTESIVDLTTKFVTYETLLANGDVGTIAGTLAIGNHTHTGVYEPADATILKESEIINTLTSTSITQPLSANMGKSLQDNKLTTTTAPVFGADSVTARTLNADLTLDGNGTGGVVVTGNLTVQGNLTTTSSNQVEIGDSVLRLNALLGSGTAPTTDAGFQVERGSSADVSLLWNETTDKWNLTEDGTNFKNILHSGNVGIANTNIVRVDDAAVLSGEFPRWTANGLESLTQTAMRTALGVDAAGTDNSTNVTLVTTTHDYLSLAGQAITLGTVDIVDDTNLVAGTGIAFSSKTLNVQYGTTSTTALRGDSGIGALADVNMTVAPANNEVLTWNSGTSKWIPSATAATYIGWTVAAQGGNSENVTSGTTVSFGSSTPNFLTVAYNTSTNVMDYAINTGTTATTLAVGNHTHAVSGLSDTAVTLVGDASDQGLILAYNEATDKWTSTHILDGGAF